jgi:flavin reductase (DIM6/NTAB) family NADH-FMN oxidoreductase RutF
MKIDPRTLNNHDSHEIMVGAIQPRPIAFVSTISKDGIYNLAPFSFYVAMCSKPAIVGFGIGLKRGGKKKDTLVNIEDTKEFVINFVSDPLTKAMNQSAGEYSSHVDEFKMVGLTPIPGDFVKAPRVAESPISMECRLKQILQFGEPPSMHSFVIGEVVQIYVNDEYLVNGVIQSSKLKAIGRLGEDLYCKVIDIFEMKRPSGPFE